MEISKNILVGVALTYFYYFSVGGFLNLCGVSQELISVRPGKQDC